MRPDLAAFRKLDTLLDLILSRHFLLIGLLKVAFDCLCDSKVPGLAVCLLSLESLVISIDFVNDSIRLDVRE